MYHAKHVAEGDVQLGLRFQINNQLHSSHQSHKPPKIDAHLHRHLPSPASLFIIFSFSSNYSSSIMISTFDSCSALPGKLPSGPSSLLTNPFHLREFRIFRRRRLKHCRHAHRRTAFTVRSQSNPFESLFHSLVSQVTSVNSLELIAPALGFSSGVALYLSNVVSPKNSAVSNIGEWILLSSPTPFNRFVFLRCPSIDFSGSDTNLVEDVSDKLMKEDRHFVRLHSGRIKATTGDDALEDKLTYQRLCISTEDGGVISLDWPSNLNLREEHGLDTTLLLVPGTPEGSMNRNVRLCVIEALARGLFPIVMNPRGCAGSPLTTARYGHCLVTSLLNFTSLYFTLLHFTSLHFTS